jgi:uncharacterized membrane protein YadS
MEASSKNPPAAPLSTPWWKNEDWLAVLAAIPVIAMVVKGLHPAMPSLKWDDAMWSGGNLMLILQVSAVIIAISALALAASLRRRVVSFIFGAAVVLSLAWLAQWLAAHTTVKAWGLEYVIFALGLGLLWSHLLPIPSWLHAAVRTEFFIKVGIVILGAGVLFAEMSKAGKPGLIQAALVIPLVWHVTMYLVRKLKVDDEFGVMLSTAVSICGVSAAIAACGAIQGDKKKLSYTTSMVLLCAVPMMIFMPWLAKSMGLTDAVAGAWLGGTLDTSGSVLAATEMISTKASEVGTVVKLSQNVLIGVAAFLISIWWTLHARKLDPNAPSPSMGVIWERFPKFVIGFVAMSLLFSYGLPQEMSAAAQKPLKALREVWFAAAFVCIGLETRLGLILSMGEGRPALAFLGGQLFNILLTLGLAYWLFS